MQMLFVAVLIVAGGFAAVLHFLHARGHFQRQLMSTISVSVFASRQVLLAADVVFVVLVVLYGLIYLA